MTRLNRTFLTLLTFVVLFVIPATAGAVTPGEPDPSYGVGGVADTGAKQDSTSIVRTAIQPDGKVLVAIILDGQPVIQLRRFNTNGSIDSAFGSGGVVAPVLAATETPYLAKVLVAADGTIYVCGSTYNFGAGNIGSPTIWAFTPGGAPKNSFDSDGKRIFTRDGSDSNFMNDAAFTPSGDIVYLGSATGASNKVLSVRLATPSGSAGAGTTAGVSGSDVYGSAIAVDPAGRYLLAGRLGLTGDAASRVFALTPSLTTDTGFGSSGSGNQAIAPSSNGFLPDTLATLNGRIFVGGVYGSAGAIATYEANGTPNIASGPGGVNRLQISGGGSTIWELHPDTTGRIVAIGSTSSPNGTFVARFNADGTSDQSFGAGGISPISGPQIAAQSMVVQADGKYVVATTDSNRGVSLRRVWGGASPPAPVAAKAGFSSSLRSKLKAKKLKTIKGTATGSGLTKVELAIQRVDSKLLKKSKRCVYVKSTKTSTKKVKAVKGKCSPSVWIAANGVSSWSVKLKKSLPAGKYVFSVRATGLAGIGSVQTKKVTLTK